MAKLNLVRSNPLGISSERYDVDKDGVNASLLGRWLACREYARLYLLGWTPKCISAGRIFGTICHGVLDAIYSQIQNGELDRLPTADEIKRQIAKIEKELAALKGKAADATPPVVPVLAQPTRPAPPNTVVAAAPAATA